ncbi:hypothetical protein B296_00055771 [Ensete ventricosum]|uniref:Uncharacterized protein n=1 Tax=Ensete ventricosum TaxID=4639 RepID=A0A426XY17_ENSVE|nr:hypothetical protein B296_00055771 [Ensete ventricosum]
MGGQKLSLDNERELGRDCFKTQPLCWHSTDAATERGCGCYGEGEGHRSPKEEVEKPTAVEEDIGAAA